jgi:hypothetical protein
MAGSEGLAAGAGCSVPVEMCQVCDYPDLQPAVFLGYLPPVNQLRPIGQRPTEQPAYPAQLLYCPRCRLVQLGLIVDPKILFPPDYPYTSGTTKILRENFQELCAEACDLLRLAPDDLIVDIGSNDGTLLTPFKAAGFRVQGIEPSRVGDLANQRGIPTLISFFTSEVAKRVRAQQGSATVVTATNVFAHIESVHDTLAGILTLIGENGVFISESHYLISLLETLQYDTIYHEHLRYYSLQSLQYLLNMHGLELIHAKRIPTHGGSIRVYAARRGARNPRSTVAALLASEERANVDLCALEAFRRRVVFSKLELFGLLGKARKAGQRVYGIGAPSRASTLINYVGLDAGIVDCIVEIKGSLKIGKYLPGTLIPVYEEARLYEDQPECALLFSWHIADELIPKLKSNGFRGSFIVPLPEPRIVA